MYDPGARVLNVHVFAGDNVFAKAEIGTGALRMRLRAQAG
jgi:hypothetical protein